MSLRQIRKLQNHTLQPLKRPVGSDEEEDDDEDEDVKPSTQGLSVFQNAKLSDSEEEEEQQAKEEEIKKKEIEAPEQKEQTESGGAKKRKKKKKKNKGAKTTQEEPPQEDHDLALLQQLKEEMKEKGGVQPPPQEVKSNTNSILKMEGYYFNAAKELQRLFQETMSEGGRKKGGARVNVEDTEQERFFVLNLDHFKGKQKQALMRAPRKYASTIMIQPKKDWIPPLPGIIEMKQISEMQNGAPVYSMQKTAVYADLDKQFQAIQESMDVQLLFQFTQRHPYHIESLLFVADFFRIQGQFPAALQFLERALFVLEHGVWANSTFSPLKIKAGQPATSLDLEASPLNKVFCECLVKYLDVLKRKSCCRTGLQFTKLLLSLDVWEDPYGALLRIDYFAIRSLEYEYLISFLSRFVREIQNDSKPSLLILPNLLFSLALAKKSLECGGGIINEDKLILRTNTELEECLMAVMSLDSLNGLLDLPSDCALICGMVLYPLFLRDLVSKTGADKAQNYVGSQFQGFQKQSWANLLKKGLLFQGSQEDGDLEAGHAWICGNPEMETFPDELTGKSPEELLNIQIEVIVKIRKVVVEQSSGLYAKEWVMQRWFKSVCGFVLNALESDTFSEQAMITALGATKPAFFLYRYRGLKLSDFSEDISTINPQELQQAMGGGPAEPQPLFEENQDAQQLIQFLNQQPQEGIDEAELMQQQALFEEYEGNN